MEDTESYRAFKTSPHRSTKHNTYFDTYDELFGPYRGKEITFVEIGILGGGSLFMWRDFFGPQARIIGVDLNPSARKWEAEGFEIFIGSQSDTAFWETFTKTVGPVDIVLDDGGHTYEQQIITTEMLIGTIRDGGMLVVEDTHTSYMSGFGPRKYSFIAYTKNIIDRINQRSGLFGDAQAERRIWSVRVYESIVAFVINTRATELPSESINNDGAHDAAIDFRHADDKLLNSIDRLAKSYRMLGKIPGARRVYRMVQQFMARRKFTARRFFR